MARPRIGRTLVWAGDVAHVATAVSARKEHFEGIRRVQVKIFGKLQDIDVLDAKRYRESGCRLIITKGNDKFEL